VKTEDEQKFLTDAARSEDGLGEPKIVTETEGERNQKNRGRGRTTSCCEENLPAANEETSSRRRKFLAQAR
jgi:hypothetical protein